MRFSFLGMIVLGLLCSPSAADDPVRGGETSESASPAPRERRRMTFERLLERFDANSDGVVTKKEFEGPLQIYYRMDDNGDGRIVRDEFEELLKRRPNALDPGARNRRAEMRGVKVGEAMPNGEVFTLEGKPVKLADQWKEKPLVLVTASITCPIAVDTCPSLKPLQEKFDPRVNVVVLYVREAHSKEQQASGKGKLGLPETEGSGIVTGFGAYPQPTTFDERLKLAKLFQRQQGSDVQILVAGMDGKLIATLGTGPNSGMLIDKDGKVVVKQHWYTAGEMHEAVAKLLGESTESGREDR